MVDCCLMMDSMTFSQNSVKVSCDWILVRLRLQSGGGGGRFEVSQYLTFVLSLL